MFGSEGKWEDVEDKVDGAAGNPPLSDAMVKTLLKNLNKKYDGYIPIVECTYCH